MEGKQIEVGKVVEVEGEEPSFVGEGFVVAGKTGEDDSATIKERERNCESKKRRAEWRPCIPCSRCFNCIQIRGYTPDGEMVTRAYMCLVLEGTTDANHTCNEAYVAKGGRLRVYIDQNPVPVGEIADELLRQRAAAEDARAIEEAAMAGGGSGEISGRLYPGSIRKGYFGGGEYAPKFDTKAGAAKKRRLMN